MTTSALDLGTVQETLLIPLAARADAARRFPGLGFRDEVAEMILARLDADTQRFASDTASMRGSIVRALWFDKAAATFIARAADGLCVSLGSGLDARAHRIGACRKQGVDWIDFDLPDVAALRNELIPACPCVQTRVADVTRPDWIATLPWTPGRPLLVLAEGVFMYLAPGTVEALVEALCRAADARGSRLELAFDYASPLMAANTRRHGSVSKTQAQFAWSLRRPRDLEDDRLRCVAHYDVAARSGWRTATLALAHRLLTGGRWIYGIAHFARTASADDDRDPPPTLAERLSPFTA